MSPAGEALMTTAWTLPDQCRSPAFSMASRRTATSARGGLVSMDRGLTAQGFGRCASVVGGAFDRPRSETDGAGAASVAPARPGRSAEQYPHHRHDLHSPLGQP